MKASAFCPAYVTGIFTIGDADAAGAGFAIDLGVQTSVEEKKSGATKILINGSEAPSIVSKAVLRRYSEKAKLGVLEISHSTPLPIGYGMGTSAAGALSLSLALNELSGAGLSQGECVKMAHDAEVECKTGLSGVDAASIGGMLARRDFASEPKKIPFEEKKLHFAFFSPIRTSTVIGSPDWKQKVNAAGESALGLLFSDMSWNGLLAQSRLFSVRSGLAAWCEKEMKANQASSMAMVGHTLFSEEPMRLSQPPLRTLEAATCEQGARLL